jgi:predicted dehydrogenase
MKTLGVGIVGTGWVSDEYIKAFHNHPDTEVVALCSRDPARAEAKAAEHQLRECAAFTDLSRMLAARSVDIVAVCTPHHLHVEQGTACARAGKHVIVEKPIAIDVPGLRQLDRTIRETGVKSIVSFVLRWNPMFDNIRSMLESNLIGQIFYAEVDYLHGVGPWYRIWEWMRKTSLGGSALLAGGCHAVDALRWFIRDEAVEVTAYSNRSRTNDLDYEYATNTVAIIRFAGGAVGKVACSLECRMPYVFNVELFGDKGTIRNNRLFTTAWPGQKDWAAIPTVEPDSGDVSHHPFQQEVNHFVECIERDVESHASVADAVKTHEICFAADQSAAQGKPVRLPLP